MDKDTEQKFLTQIEETKAKIADLVEKQQKEVAEIGATSKATAEALKEAEKKFADATLELKERADKLEAAKNRPSYGKGESFKSPGQRFVDSEEYKNRSGYSTKDFGVKSFFERKEDTGIAGLTEPNSSDNAPVWSERLAEIIFDAQRVLTLRQLVATGRTNSNSIEYFEETDFDPKDAGSQPGYGKLKPQLAMNFEKKTAAVETIAAWVPAARQVLEDAPQLASHIDSRLTYAVENELEKQVLYGTGANSELLGIMNTPNIKDNDKFKKGNRTGIDLIRYAIAQVRLSEYPATAVVLNPMDFAVLELEKGSDARYVWAVVTENGVRRLWGVPVIETTQMEQGQFLVGAFGLGAQLFDREMATIRVSDSHSDLFVRNAVAILGELRAALAVYRPKAFVKGTLESTAST